ncbi:unnamed protein product [Clonostachys rhizophaga]|uniref:Uncharacterized protein n=1 Tax=Clonostachys rhizophaga TaxID=160324 RepID=A0A9N9UZH9_9HYPO|nr:unnamed protein product [Clonostachys rhizophaga]
MFAGEMTYVRPFTASYKPQVPDKGAKSIELARLDPVHRPSSEAAKHKKLANPKAVDVTVNPLTDQKVSLIHNRSICQMCYEGCLGAGIEEDQLG